MVGRDQTPEPASGSDRSLLRASEPSGFSPVSREVRAFLGSGRFVWLAALALAFAAKLSATEIPDYKVGDIATNDFTTPIPLVVIDTEATEALKQKEGSRVPVICRYYTNAIGEAQLELRAAFSSAQSNFLDRVEAAFKQRKLDPQAIASDKFSRLTAAFQRQNRSFPLSTNLAVAWALGDSDAGLQEALAGRLREAMNRPIRPPNILPEVKFGYTVRLVALADWDEPLTLDMADQFGFNISRSNIVTFTRLREELQQSFPPEERAIAKFLTFFLKTNCLPDVELTHEARAKRTDPLWAADRYEAGQTLARRGQVIDKKIKAALDQLREKTAMASLQQLQAKPQHTALPYGWIAAGTAALVMGFLVLILRWALQPRANLLLPTTVPGHPSGNLGDVRERLLPHLARLMMDRLFMKLVSQRAHLLDAQQKAVADMAELEERLEKVHAPLQDRLRAYEQRISELEKELVLKGEENRELIKAKIQMARKQLEEAKDQLGLN